MSAEQAELRLDVEGDGLPYSEAEFQQHVSHILDVDATRAAWVTLEKRRLECVSCHDREPHLMGMAESLQVHERNGAMGHPPL